MFDNKDHFYYVRSRIDKYNFTAFDKDQVARLIVSVIYDNKSLSDAVRYHSLPIGRRPNCERLIKQYEDDYTSSDIKVLLAKEYDKIKSTTVISANAMIAKIARDHHVSKYAPRRFSRLMRQNLIW
jgi:hypothetical protein